MSVSAPWTPIAEDVELAKHYGELRARKTHTRHIDPSISNIRVHQRGLLGEILFERTFGWPFDRRLEWDGGVDFVVNGIPVGVKTTHMRSRGIVLQPHGQDDGKRVETFSEIRKAKVLVLISGCCEKGACVCRDDDRWWHGPWQLRGWIRVSHFTEQARHWIGQPTKDAPGTDRWSVEQHQLCGRWNEHWFRNEGPKVNEINWG